MNARDGVIGNVKDFYFDDQHWHVRYLVVATGGWLKGREVHLSPEAVHARDWTLRVVPVDLTTEQVRQSPGIETEFPIAKPQ